MKNILIIGKNSYIGTHIDSWLTKNGIIVNQLDVLTEDWNNFDYSNYDVIIHVAAIVHRPNCNDWNLYKQVNTDMPIKIAKIAKKQGVKQYIYLSSMAVYGRGKELRKNVIDENSKLGSSSFYGKSKLLAEEGLLELQDNTFNIMIIRPPSVYGKDCKGGYISGFSSFVKKLPIIPLAYENVKQSMLYIDNLSELIRIGIQQNLQGIYCPQDDISVSANEICKAIANGLNKSLKTSKFLGLFVKLFHFLPIINKAYGGIEYSKHISTIEGINYVVVPFIEGMRRTVSK